MRQKPVTAAFNALPLTVIFLCSMAAALPLYTDGLPLGDDWIFELVRAADFHYSFTNGTFPARWSDNLEEGYGLPIYNFFPPFPLLIVSMLLSSGIPLTAAIKMLVFLSTLAGAAGMYLFARNHFGEKWALISTVVFSFAPYHFFDAFSRNAFSEMTAIGIAPWLFYGISVMLKQPSGLSGMITTAISAGMLLLTHVLSIIMYFPLLCIYAAVNAAAKKNYATLPRIGLALGLAALIASFFILPVIAELRFIQSGWLTTGKFNVLTNLTPLASLFFGPARHSLTPLAPVFFLLALITIAVHSRQIGRENLVNTGLFGAATVLFVLLILPASAPVWQNVSSLQVFQFPWRLLSPATFALSFFSGGLSLAARSSTSFRAVFFLVVSCSAGMLYFQSGKEQRPYSSDLEAMKAQQITVSFIDGATSLSGDDISALIHLRPGFEKIIAERKLRATVLHEYRPLWSSGSYRSAAPGEIIIASGIGSAVLTTRRPGHLRYRLNLPQNTQLTAQINYFPGWNAYAEGKRIEMFLDKQGLIALRLPAGIYDLDLKFENTVARTAGNLLSITGLLILLSLLTMASIRRFRRNRSPVSVA